MIKRCFNDFVIICMVLGFILILHANALALDGGSGDSEGAHNQRLPGLKDSVCKRCHFSKGGKGIKIWEDPPMGAETITGTKGMRNICQSCHYPGNAVNALSGFALGYHPLGGHEYRNSNVFVDQLVSGQGEDHVMHDWAEIDPDKGRLSAELNPAFPLKEDDEWGHPMKKGDVKNKGFYCGSCHDPHNQPKKRIDGTGDYLRIKEGGEAGTSGNRTAFCIQCHQNLPEHPQHGVDLGCQKCHHPHDGFISIEEQTIVGQWIILIPVQRINFRALPNVPSFGTRYDGIDEDISSVCYGCHSPNRPEEFSYLGFGILFGDDTDTPKEHHPMGEQALISMLIHADNVEVPSPEGQLTCISCHEGFHEGRNPYYLRYDFTEDSAYFCSMCHSDKTAEDLGQERGNAHRQVFGKSANGRGDCMFCHFIHDGQDQGVRSLPVVEAIIRIDPLNLAWSTKEDDRDNRDYEDICFGCHGDIVYMKGSGAYGAMLKPDQFASHPISGIPGFVEPKGGFQVSDGLNTETINDYGVPAEEIFCGSCHNIHRASNKPYLRVDASPYKGGEFCEGCHTKNPAGGISSHPVDVPPHEEKTLPEFPKPLFGGGSGDPKGRTEDNTKNGKILCITCHNMHAAQTTHQGDLVSRINMDDKAGRHGHLLCVDNFSSEDGSDLCLLCHKPFEAISESRHNFSDLDFDEISARGICSVCHTPHRTKDKLLLWPRSLSEERNIFSQDDKPNYIPGFTIFCYDCHEDNASIDNDPPLYCFFDPPQDIAFTDGPGASTKVGYYDTIPPRARPPVDGSPTGGHYIQTEQITKLKHNIETGDNLPCDLCHDPHSRNSNQVLLKNPLGVNTVDNLEASRHTRNGTGTGRQICASCHGYSERDAMIGLPVKIYDFEVIRTTASRAEHSKGNDTPCTNCHQHNRIAPIQNQQHFIHLASSTGSVDYYTNSSSLRKKDIVDRGLRINDCRTCHPPELAYESGELKFEDDKPLMITNVCQPCHSQGGTYDGVTDKVIGAKLNWQNTPYNSNGTLKLGKELWCLGCHDEEPSVIKVPGSNRYVVAPNIYGEKSALLNNEQGYGFLESGHGLAPYFDYRDSERKGAGLICTDCHDPNAPHILIEYYSAKKANYQSGYRLRSIKGKEPMIIPRWRDEYWTGDFNLCYSCHMEEEIIGLGFGYRSYTTNHNPFFMVEEVKTGFQNVDLTGLNRHNTVRGPSFDFLNYYPGNSHWNHLALPNALVTLSTSGGGGGGGGGGGVSRTNRCIDSRCHDKVVWDSDRDGWLDSRPSCTTCHNPHGTRFPSMTRNDLAITHDRSGPDWTYGYIGSRNYSLFSRNEEEDLYCSECHAKLMRYGESNYSYYRKLRLGEDTTIPEAPQ